MQESKLKELVTRYSEFMNFPIYIQVGAVTGPMAVLNTKASPACAGV
jgi:HSP90 family molecular chaperone